jgi:TolB-like protein/rhodanese-related sulfurtransferase/Flp pilus assembly protein TadD
MPFDLEDMGEQELKGFDDPVRVYRVELSANQSLPSPQQNIKKEASQKKPRLVIATIVIALVVTGGATYWLKTQEPKVEAASIERMAFPLPDKPSIAVLPFTNMSGDPEQEYFADGMTDDLITDLSKLSGLFIIARNSTFSYKGKQVKVGQIAEELGVRYILEGSVRRAGNQVRINAQLIDATSGGHLWADRYDGSLDDIFELQDNITQSIVTALSLTLTAREQEQRARKETGSPKAYDAFLRGWVHYRLSTPGDFTQAIPYFENAIELAPDFARAHAALAATYWGIWEYTWAERTGVTYDDALKKTNRHLEEAMKNPTPLALRIAAKQHEFWQRWDEAMTTAERAIALDPNDPIGYEAMGELLVNLGRPAEGLEFIKKAIRLDPQSDYLSQLGYAQFHLERYDEAAATLLRATRRNPDFEWNFLLLAAAYGHLGREQEAEPAIARFNTMYHDPTDKQRPFTLADVGDYWAIKDEAELERIREGLRKVGVPAGTTAKPDIRYRDLVTMSAGTFDVEGAIEIDAVEAKTLHDRGTAFIDSRGSGHYGRSHIPGATNLYFHQVWDGLSEVVGLNDEVVFYCGGPDCHLSANSSAQAIALGYTKVYYFAGGFSAWKNASYPVEGS